METSKNKNPSSEKIKYIGFLAGAAILWSLGGILIKLVTWNPIAIAGMRSAIAACMMLFILKKPSITKWSKPKIGGTIAYVCTVMLFVTANKMTTAANAILLQYTAPIYVALFGAWLLKEKTKVSDWVTIFFVFSGMILFFIDKVGPGKMMGNLLAILSGFSFGIQVVFMRMQKDASPVESVFWGNVLTAIISIPFMFQSLPDLKSWGGLLLLGVFQLGFSYLLYAAAIKHVSALEAILIPIIEPILNPIWVFLIVGETPGKWALVGGAIVVLSVTGRYVLQSIKQTSLIRTTRKL